MEVKAMNQPDFSTIAKFRRRHLQALSDLFVQVLKLCRAAARIVAEGMRGTLDQPVIVEDVPGADGTIGVRRAARAAPDGYTLSFGQSGTHVLNGAVYPLDYDCLTDFAPISLLTSNPYVLVTRKDLAPQDVRELI